MSAVHPVWWGGAQTLSGVCVEVLMEQHVLAPCRIVATHLRVAEGGSSTLAVGHEDSTQALRKFSGNLLKGQQPARSGGEVEAELIAKQARESA